MTVRRWLLLRVLAALQASPQTSANIAPLTVTYGAIRESVWQELKFKIFLPTRCILRLGARCMVPQGATVRNGRLRVPNTDIPTRILMRYIVPRVDVAYTSERYL